ncbi:hypothetical protein LWI29_037914 [Acer saccharum]|uniref:Uncharacterized protein n=1 Tax=Acer saccharum TaxID=4024 RepID=A0AA39RZU2_ACESA|nr:hypothetical protein LWI29_037914 [Acer saccharum]
MILSRLICRFRRQQWLSQKFPQLKSRLGRPRRSSKHDSGTKAQTLSAVEVSFSETTSLSRKRFSRYPALVSSDWISGRLGLQKGVSAASMSHRSKGFSKNKGFPRNDQLISSVSKIGGVATIKAMSFQIPSKGPDSCEVGQAIKGLDKGTEVGFSSGLLDYLGLVVGAPKKVMLKGKGILIKKANRKPPPPLLAQPNLILDKSKSLCEEKDWPNEESGESSYDDSMEANRFQGLKFIGETSVIGMDQIRGGNIIIDLGDGLGQDIGPSFKEALLKDGSCLIPHMENNGVQLPNEIVSDNGVSSEVSLSSSGDSISHISETLYNDSNNIVEKTEKKGVSQRKNLSSKKRPNQAAQLSVIE